jgi:hypothetical protein
VRVTAPPRYLRSYAAPEHAFSRSQSLGFSLMTASSKAKLIKWLILDSRVVDVRIVYTDAISCPKP